MIFFYDFLSGIWFKTLYSIKVLNIANFGFLKDFFRTKILLIFIRFYFKVTKLKVFYQLLKMYLIFAASLLHLFMQGGLVYVILKVIEEIVKYC